MGRSSSRGGGGGGFSGGGRRTGSFSGSRSSGGRSAGFSRGPSTPRHRAPNYRPSSHSSGDFSAGFLIGQALSSARDREYTTTIPQSIPQQPVQVSPAPQAAPSNGGGGVNKGGCLKIAVIAFIVFLAIGCISLLFDSSDVPASTVEREPLPATAVVDAGYYTDLDGYWVNNPAAIESGLKHFHQETGVQPHVIILPNGSMTSPSDLSAYAGEAYEEIFTDESRIMLVFCDDNMGSYVCGYAVGAQASTIMDSEALGILAAYTDRYYYDQSISEEEIFSNTFRDTADRIMTVTTSPVVYVAVCLVMIVVIAAVYLVMKKRREQREAEQKRIDEILSKPLEKFSDSSLDELEKKYASDEETAESEDEVAPAAGAK